MVLLQAKQPAQSVHDFNRVIERIPRHDMARRFRGLARIQLGNEAGAAEDFKVAQAANPRAFEHFLRNLRPEQAQDKVRKLLRE